MELPTPAWKSRPSQLGRRRLPISRVHRARLPLWVVAGASSRTPARRGEAPAPPWGPRRTEGGGETRQAQTLAARPSVPCLVRAIPRTRRPTTYGCVTRGAGSLRPPIHARHDLATLRGADAGSHTRPSLQQSRRRGRATPPLPRPNSYSNPEPSIFFGERTWWMYVRWLVVVRRPPLG